MWVSALGVPVMVTWTWLALYESDYRPVGDTDFAWAPIGPFTLGLLVFGVNLFAALIATIFSGGAVSGRVVITLLSGALAVVVYVPMGFMGVTSGVYGREWRGVYGEEGFRGRSGAVMLVLLVVSLVPVVMMWLSARPPNGARHRRWWESAVVRAIAAGTLIAGVGLTAAYWLTSADAEVLESVAFGEVEGRTVLSSGGWDEMRLWVPATGTQIGSPLT